jgi:cyclic di-GMP phosphodiesterase
MRKENQTLNKTLLIVDDEPNVISSLKRQLRHDEYNIQSANSGVDGLDLLRSNDIGVVVSDQMMPEMDGVTFLESAKQLNPDIVRILLTAYNSLTNAMAAINRSQIFAYLTKPWSSEALKGTLSSAFDHYNLVVENKRLHKLTHEQNDKLKLMNENLEDMVRKRTFQLEEAVREGVVMLAMAAEAKDGDTGKHINRICSLTYDICLELGMSSKESDEISFFSIMHDVGKIHISDRILQNTVPSLSDEDWARMKTHSIEGEKILGNKIYYKIARTIARSHHERWDGTGYPDGLKGESIPLAARIVTVADVYDALIHERSYKSAWPVKKAIAEMKSLSGKLFDPEVLNAFLKIHRDKENEKQI